MRRTKTFVFTNNDTWEWWVDEARPGAPCPQCGVPGIINRATHRDWHKLLLEFIAYPHTGGKKAK